MLVIHKVRVLGSGPYTLQYPSPLAGAGGGGEKALDNGNEIRYSICTKCRLQVCMQSANLINRINCAQQMPEIGRSAADHGER